ncbi:30S ribosomal protein S3 [Candidatus Micrarchaeota archaeon CG1_02_47_40]|nr:MAG: 30S ribosomal protein S3 [Candidatus Micrarchaeota archaeon CG1_02_47_40]
MGVERKFIEDAIVKYRVSRFLEQELDRAGFSRLEIQRTPLVTRIAVEVTNPGKVIGRKGRTIKELTDAISREFKLENPQISVVEITNQSRQPRLVAKKACRYIEQGKKVRAILHSLLREVMGAGALGAEIIAAGKIAAKGARAKKLRVAAGYIPKAGEPARLVDSAHVTAYPKSGAIGVLVRIVQPGTVFPDKVPAAVVELPRIIAAAEDVERSGKEGETAQEQILRIRRDEARKKKEKEAAPAVSSDGDDKGKGEEGAKEKGKGEEGAKEKGKGEEGAKENDEGKQAESAEEKTEE